jgi:uncharacterized protein YtpQ (UPF0354 family)
VALSEWLQKKRRGRKAFDETCLQKIRQQFPSATAIYDPANHSIHVSLGGGESTVYTGNLWRIIENPGEAQYEKEQAFGRWLEAVTASFSDKRCLTAESIIPQIKDEVYFQQTGPDGLVVPCVREHLVGDLWIAYGIDSPSSITSLQPAELDELGIPHGQLRDLAISNLRRILPAVERHGDGSTYYMLTAGGDYTASLLLFDEVWEEQIPSVEGDIVAVVPSRDVLLFTGSENSNGLTEMLKAADRLTLTGSYLVSGTMLRRSNSRWYPFD